MRTERWKACQHCARAGGEEYLGHVGDPSHQAVRVVLVELVLHDGIATLTVTAGSTRTATRIVRVTIQAIPLTASVTPEHVRSGGRLTLTVRTAGVVAPEAEAVRGVNRGPAGGAHADAGWEHRDEAQPEGTSVILRSLTVFPLSLRPSFAGRIAGPS